MLSKVERRRDVAYCQGRSSYLRKSRTQRLNQTVAKKCNKKHLDLTKYQFFENFSVATGLLIMPRLSFDHKSIPTLFRVLL